MPQRASFRSRVHRQLDPGAWTGAGLSPVNAWQVLLILLAIVYSISVGGKIAASFLAIAGVGLIALPAGIMAGAMQEAMRREPGAREQEG